MTDSFTRIMGGARSALAYMDGSPPAGTVVHVPEDLDVAGIRNRTGLAQPAFAATIGVSLHTLRNWEQKRRRPEGRPGCCWPWSRSAPRWCRRS